MGSNPTLSATEPLSKYSMILRTVEQVRRVFRIVAGFTFLLAGAVMLVTRGPGWLVIFLGLGLLAAEFVWPAGSWSGSSAKAIASRTSFCARK